MADAQNQIEEAKQALAEARGRLMDGEAIWQSLLSINSSADVRSGVSEERARLQEKIDKAKAILAEAEAELKTEDPGPVEEGGRRRKTRKGRGGRKTRKAKKGTRRH